MIYGQSDFDKYYYLVCVCFFSHASIWCGMACTSGECGCDGFRCFFFSRANALCAKRSDRRKLKENGFEIWCETKKLKRKLRQYDDDDISKKKKLESQYFPYILAQNFSKRKFPFRSNIIVNIIKLIHAKCRS